MIGPGGGRDLVSDEADLLTHTEASARLEEEATVLRRRLETFNASPAQPEPPEIAEDRLRLSQLTAALDRYRKAPGR